MIANFWIPGKEIVLKRTLNNKIYLRDLILFKNFYNIELHFEFISKLNGDI